MKRAYTLIELAVVLAILGILAAILFPVFNRTKCSGSRASCQSNLKQVGLSFMQYTQDYDERFPPVSLHAVASSTVHFARPFGWADVLQAYIKSTRVYQCPSEKISTEPGVDAARPGFTDYFYNTNFSRRPLKLVPLPSMTLLVGDGNGGGDATDARYNRSALPREWLGSSESPARRHLDTANYLFADGHVKGFKPGVVKAKRSGESDYSFAP